MAQDEKQSVAKPPLSGNVVEVKEPDVHKLAKECLKLASGWAQSPYPGCSWRLFRAAKEWVCKPSKVHEEYPAITGIAACVCLCAGADINPVLYKIAYETQCLCVTEWIENRWDQAFSKNPTDARAAQWKRLDEYNHTELRGPSVIAIFCVSYYKLVNEDLLFSLAAGLPKGFISWFIKYPEHVILPRSPECFPVLIRSFCMWAEHSLHLMDESSGVGVLRILQSFRFGYTSNPKFLGTFVCLCFVCVFVCFFIYWCLCVIIPVVVFGDLVHAKALPPEHSCLFLRVLAVLQLVLIHCCFDRKCFRSGASQGTGLQGHLEGMHCIFLLYNVEVQPAIW